MFSVFAENVQVSFIFLSGLKSSVHKLEHENADLKFLNSQYVHKVKAVERESALKNETIQKLQEKNLQAVIQTPGIKILYIFI